MQISLLCVGQTDENQIKQLIEKYEKRLPSHYNFNRIELPDIKNRKNLTIEQQKLQEEKLILEKIKSGDFVILLDENGKTMSSLKFANFLNQQFVSMTQHLVFVIGGPYGFSQGMYQRSNYKISLSAMTFTHQMVRLFFVEQLYRAFTILQGKSYHHE
ncbi:23S rRNA (pseudouridine(1915)-N(3))-methyltransferase RlmH [Flavobacteriaceae bacterium Ap0902]|nr:23S rRNA (pseudouridine(1915)-N(3))-methyltransferase RlmH [Flavobacteriaceae bacterium Ap0902]